MLLGAWFGQIFRLSGRKGVRSRLNCTFLYFNFLHFCISKSVDSVESIKPCPCSVFIVVPCRANSQQFFLYWYLPFLLKRGISDLLLCGISRKNLMVENCITNYGNFHPCVNTPVTLRVPAHCKPLNGQLNAWVINRIILISFLLLLLSFDLKTIL